MAEDRQSIYERFLDERTIFLRDNIDPHVSTDIAVQLLYLDKEGPGEKIKLYINSRGGIIQDALAIYDVMNAIKSSVSTICLGNAGSMAAILLMAGTKGERYSLPNAKVMIHQPGLHMLSGRETEITNYTDQLKADRDRLETIISIHTGQPVSRIHADCEKDFHMTAQEAKSYGIIDEIITRV